MRAWFISDIHIKELNERNGNTLLRFLHSVADKTETATHIFFLGDIFDLWVGDHAYYIKKFSAFFDVVRKIKALGIEIHYFEGNHDLHLKKFWNKMDIPCYVDAKYFQLGKWTVRAEHGDLINTKDLAYDRYRRSVRHPFSERALEIIPAMVINQIGETFSHISRKFSSQKRRDNEAELREMIRLHAKTKISERNFDYIITGHMHIRDEFSFNFNQKEIYSINLGSWFDVPKALLLTEKGHEWVGLD